MGGAPARVQVRDGGLRPGHRERHQRDHSGDQQDQQGQESAGQDGLLVQRGVDHRPGRIPVRDGRGRLGAAVQRLADHLEGDADRGSAQERSLGSGRQPDGRLTTGGKVHVRRTHVEAQRLIGITGDHLQLGLGVAPVAQLDDVPTAPATRRGDRDDLGLQAVQLADLEIRLGRGAGVRVEGRGGQHAEGEQPTEGAAVRRWREDHRRRGVLLGVDGDLRWHHLGPGRGRSEHLEPVPLDQVPGVGDRDGDPDLTTGLHGGMLGVQADQRVRHDRMLGPGGTERDAGARSGSEPCPAGDWP